VLPVCCDSAERSGYQIPQMERNAPPNPNHLNNMRAKVASSLKFSARQAKGSNPSSSAS